MNNNQNSIGEVPAPTPTGSPRGPRVARTNHAQGAQDVPRREPGDGGREESRMGAPGPPLSIK